MNDQGKKRLLLVEDEFVTAKITTKILEAFGYEVIWSNTGERAIDEVVNDSSIDLVLMDIDLGIGIDGTETALQILEYKKIPIVFLTSHSEKEMVEKVRGITRYGYVIKESGDFVLQSSIEMAFELFEAHRQLEYQMISINETRERLDYALNAVNEAVWDFHPKENYIFWNPNYYMMLGYEPNQFPATYENWKQLIHPEDVYMAEFALMECLNGGRDELNQECRFVTHEGLYRWIHIKGRIINRDEKGEALRIIGTHTDITERKQIEEKALLTYHMMDDIIASIPSGLFIYQFVEPDRLYLIKANEEAGLLTSLNVKEYIGKEFNEIWPNAKALGITDNYLEVIHNGKNIELIDTYYSDDRVTGVFRVKAFKIPGDKLGIAFENVTKIKKAEAELHKTQEVFNQFLEHSPIYVFIKDETAKAIYLSRNFEQLVGMPVDKVLNRDMREIFPIEFAEKIISDDLKILHGGVEVVLDEELNGRYYQTIKFPIFLENNPIYLAGFTIDITNQKMTEKELFESKEHYKKLVEILPEAFIIHTEGIIVFANQKAADVVGYSNPQEVLGKSIFDFLVPEYHKFSQKRIEKTFENGKATQLAEEEIFHKDGQRLTVEVSTISFKFKDKPSVLTILNDITDRKKADDKIRDLLQEKELMLKEVHHRVKNNMYIIASLLAMQSESCLDQGTIDTLMDARNRVISMMIIYDKLYKSNSFIEISLQDYLNELLDLVVSTFPQRTNVLILKEIDNLMIDSKKMFIIGLLINELLTNSFKHGFKSQPKGQISILLKESEQKVYLSFSDNGCGIPEKIIKDRSKGFGLNLVDLLTEQLEGDLEIRCQGGTEFILRFPL